MPESLRRSCLDGNMHVRVLCILLLTLQGAHFVLVLITLLPLLTLGLHLHVDAKPHILVRVRNGHNNCSVQVQQRVDTLQLPPFPFQAVYRYDPR